MTQEAPYRIELIQEKDTEDVLKLLRRTFYLDEPMNKTLGLCTSPTDLCPELDNYCTKSLNEGLSYKALDNENNIISVIICGICPLKEDENGNDLLSLAKRCENPKFQRILYILARRESGARLWERFPHEETLVEVKVAATDPKWRQKGLMKVLLQASEKATLQKNIKLMRMDTSSAYSAMTAERLGYTCVYNARYRDIKLDGQPLIVPDPPHEEDSVYVKMLFDPTGVTAALSSP